LIVSISFHIVLPSLIIGLEQLYVKAGILHRDLSPRIRLVANGHALVIDLDMATNVLHTPSENTEVHSSYQMSDASRRTGTKAYMSIGSSKAALKTSSTRNQTLSDDLDSLYYCLLLLVTERDSTGPFAGWSKHA
jgi:hypothetical protein